MGRSRKPLCGQPYRGFESLSLRQPFLVSISVCMKIGPDTISCPTPCPSSSRPSTDLQLPKLNVVGSIPIARSSLFSYLGLKEIEPVGVRDADLMALDREHLRLRLFSHAKAPSS